MTHTEPQTSDEKPARKGIGPDSLVTLGTLVGVVTLVAAGMFKLRTWELADARWKTQIDANQMQLVRDVAKIDQRLENMQDDSWTVTSQVAWAATLATLNPSVTVPPVPGAHLAMLPPPPDDAER